ncbi:MAG: hypothetical protein JNK34_07190 [Tabrizicola sp.]|nr:hypothetical protein [Tabrizicola sp.]
MALSVAALAGCVDTGTTFVSSGSTNRHVTLYNASYVSITHFYGSNVGSSSWEEDILGSSVIPPGGVVDIDFDDGTGACLFDFKAIFADGSSAVEEGIDVCRTSSVTVG